jgi:ABC-2 type transport system permease protein
MNSSDNTISLPSFIHLHYWKFKRQKNNWVLLAVFLIAGIYSLYQGFSFKHKQISTIETFAVEKQKVIDDQIQNFHADTTTAEGKAKFNSAGSVFIGNRIIALPAFKKPISTAIYNIGQADAFPYYYTIKVENFFMQLFKQGEINNPLRSLAGHFDVTFWVIYLLPLLIILLSFNAFSAELDNGNWRLIFSQGISARYWLTAKLLLTAILVEILLILIFATGIILNAVSFQQTVGLQDLYFFVTVNLYLILWFALVYFINSFAKSTSFNALCSGMLWITTCMLMPALVTMLAETVVEVDNTIVSTMSRRPQGDKFDNDDFGKQTVRKLGDLHPAYKNARIAPGMPAFKLSVFIAYHELLNETHTIDVKEYYASVEKRQAITNGSIFINPAAGVDGLLTSLAANDAQANHKFIWQVRAFQKKIHEVYFPALFNTRPLQESDYKKLPVFKAESDTKTTPFLSSSFLFLLTASYVFYVLGNQKLRKLAL